MAGRGPAPKATRSRPRDQKRVDGAVTVVAADGELHGPELPEGFEWPEPTRGWWATWRKSAQAKTFTDTDWSFLIDTAVLHSEFWLGNVSAGAELRLRVAKFGATPEDRARLKISVGEPVGATVPTAAAKKTASARKGRLLKVVGGSEA